MSKIHNSFRAIFTSFLLAAVAVSPVCAQTQPATAKAPETKFIGDWGVRCFATVSASPCEMQETATQTKTGQRVMNISVAFVPRQSRYIFQLALPLGVSLAKGAKIVAQSFSAPTMAFRRCDRSGCYVEGFIDPKIIDALGHDGGAAKILIASNDGRSIGLPLSLKGFAEARTAMEDLAREKAEPAKP
jgi:invasion protein IalB